MPLLRDLSHKSLNSGNATGPHCAIHHSLIVPPSNGIQSDMLTASVINQLYITDTQPITGLPIHLTSIYGFSFSRVNRTHATNIKVRNWPPFPQQYWLQSLREFSDKLLNVNEWTVLE